MRPKKARPARRRTSRAMRVVFLSLVLLSVASVHACSLLAPVPFRVRAIRSSDHIWTGDVYFSSWAPGLQVTVCE